MKKLSLALIALSLVSAAAFAQSTDPIVQRRAEDAAAAKAADAKKDAANKAEKAINKKADDEIWFGTLDVKIVKLRLECLVSKDAAGQYHGAIFSLDQNNARIELDEFKIAD